MSTGAPSHPARDFLSVAGALALLSPEQVEQLTAEAAARQSLPSQLALQKGLLSVTQIDIVETLLRPTEAIPGYEIVGVLGQEGMGVVYRARQLNLKRVVALKTVLVTEMGDESALERFEQEAQAVARLSHPHIIAAFDFGRHEGRLYFAMELVEGEDVHQRIARCGPLDERTVWSLVRQAAAGLAHAAQQGIVHRDIKPANLLLVEPPAGFPLPPGIPLLKIADFGLARLAAAADETRLTSVGTTVGSPHYMPPEQLRGEPVDLRADIFALGASAFHMFAGRPPLAGKTMTQIVAYRLGDQTESLSLVRPGVTRKSAELVAAMMAPDPERRIADYGELARRIDELGQPVMPAALDSATAPYLPVASAPPTTPITTEPTQPIVAPRRRPNLNWLILAVAGLAVLLVILGTFGRRNPTGERDLVASGRVEQLFNGRNINGWRTVSGGWNPAKNQEGAIVLQGRGAIRRPLVARDAAGELQPLDHYRLIFLVDFHEAAAVELQFDLSDGDSDNKCRVVRIDRERSALGRRDASQGPPYFDTSLAHAADSDAGMHAIQLERQSHGWWVFVDERFLGSAPFDTATLVAEFGLVAEGGAAWFSDFTVEGLVPPAAISQTR